MADQPERKYYFKCILKEPCLKRFRSPFCSCQPFEPDLEIVEVHPLYFYTRSQKLQKHISIFNQTHICAATAHTVAGH